LKGSSSPSPHLFVIPAKAGIQKNKMKAHVYILANKRNGTLYIGVTSDLVKRIWQHKNKLIEGFTKKYNVIRLVYYEECEDIETAIQREKRTKKWERAWKIRIIEENNPNWDDLYDEIIK
jgi:putative endonuclease